MGNTIQKHYEIKQIKKTVLVTKPVLIIKSLVQSWQPVHKSSSFANSSGSFGIMTANNVDLCSVETINCNSIFDNSIFYSSVQLYFCYEKCCLYSNLFN